MTSLYLGKKLPESLSLSNLSNLNISLCRVKEKHLYSFYLNYTAGSQRFAQSDKHFESCLKDKIIAFLRDEFSIQFYSR